ncbi:MAG: DUF5335 family protein [Acidobacteria bacterium]|nr:DUF5335 family protein [Acidobacteriota bacterium]MBP7475549.1 DUF5335 family protein [Pyrinomonadaceae bacterium]MBP9110870.1 DUF5335 family protein [Pyrinomonadaceae bacterium]
MSYELKREDWKKFFDILSKRRFEWKTEIEVLSPTLGDQILNISLPFNGITVEEVDGTSTLVLSVGETTDQHQTHTILNPVRVAFLASENDRGDVVAVEEADGTKTLIRFVEPIDLLVGFTTIEMVATTG